MLADAPEIETGGFTPLEEGKYPLKVIKCDLRTSQKGKDGFNITTEVIDGPGKGRKVFHTFWVSPESPKAMSFFFANMVTLGVSNAFFQTNPTNDQVAAKLVDAVFEGVVTIDTSNESKPRNEIRYFNKLATDPNDPFSAPPAAANDPFAGFAPASAPTPEPATAPEPVETAAEVEVEAPEVTPAEAPEAPF
jgi:hypothetical protein